MKTNKMLLSLVAEMGKFLVEVKSTRQLWYWDYYKAIERDIENENEKRKIYQQIYHLERFGYLDKDGLTNKGFLKLTKEKCKTDKNIQWDKKWRIVIFDIPEKMRKYRDSFRVFLLDLGFLKLQNSIWINYQGDFDEIQNILKIIGIEKYVVLIVADKISNNLLFEKKFKLK